LEEDTPFVTREDGEEEALVKEEDASGIDSDFSDAFDGTAEGEKDAGDSDLIPDD